MAGQWKAGWDTFRILGAKLAHRTPKMSRNTDTEWTPNTSGIDDCRAEF